MFSLLTHMPNVYIVEGVTVFGCFLRFFALLQVSHSFVCGVDCHEVFQLREIEDTLPLTAEEELRENRQLLVGRRAQSHYSWHVQDSEAI